MTSPSLVVIAAKPSGIAVLEEEEEEEADFPVGRRPLFVFSNCFLMSFGEIKGGNLAKLN